MAVCVSCKRSVDEKKPYWLLAQMLGGKVMQEDAVLCFQCADSLYCDSHHKGNKIEITKEWIVPVKFMATGVLRLRGRNEEEIEDELSQCDMGDLEHSELEGGSFTIDSEGMKVDPEWITY